MKTATESPIRSAAMRMLLFGAAGALMFTGCAPTEGGGDDDDQVSDDDDSVEEVPSDWADNGYPADLRGRLFYLSEFTRHQTNQILNGAADAQVLIDINTSIMKGLKGEPVQKEPSSWPD